MSFGADNDDDVYKLYLKSKTILREGGFNLRKFVTNSMTLQQRINEAETEFVDQGTDCSKKRIEEEDKT